MQQLPIFPCRRQQSIFGAKELNFCVRDGNRWDLFAIVTAMVYFRRIAPSLISFDIIYNLMYISYLLFVSPSIILTADLQLHRTFLVPYCFSLAKFLHIIKVSYFLFALLSHSHEIKPSTY